MSQTESQGNISFEARKAINDYAGNDEERAQLAETIEELFSLPCTSLYQCSLEPITQTLLNTNEKRTASRILDYLKNQNIIYLGDLVRLDRGFFLRGENIGRTSVEHLETVLRSIGLKLGMNDLEIRAFEMKPNESFLAKYQPSQKVYHSTAPRYEINDSPQIIGGEMMMPGSTYFFTSGREAHHFSKCVKDVFEKSEEATKDPAYSSVVTCLPAQLHGDKKEYPVHLSDPALVLATWTEDYMKLQQLLGTKHVDKEHNGMNR